MVRQHSAILRETSVELSQKTRNIFLQEGIDILLRCLQSRYDSGITAIDIRHGVSIWYK
jgi:hypothetical protein